MEPTTLTDVATVDGAVLDVEHGSDGDYLYTLVNSAGVKHARADGTTETIGADLWRGRLNAFVGYRHITVAPDGTLYVSDSTTKQVWKVEPATDPWGELTYTMSTPTVVAGRGKSCYDTMFELYPDTYGSYTRIAGGACYNYTGWLMDNPDYGLSLETGEPDDGSVATGALLTPWGIAVNAEETLIALAEVSAGKGPAVRVIDLAEGTISTYAGWVPGDNSSCDHPALSGGREAVGVQDYWGTFRMPFCNVFDVAFRPDGSIAFSAGSYYTGTIEGGLLTVRDNGVVRTLEVLAGCAGPGCTADAGATGPGTLLSAMTGLDARIDGAIFYADTQRHLVRKLDPDTGTVTDVVGTGSKCGDLGTCGAAASGIPALEADLGTPRTVAIGSGGGLLIAEETASYYVGPGVGWRNVLRRAS